jgi:hypothetical protein
MHTAGMVATVMGAIVMEAMGTVTAVTVMDIMAMAATDIVGTTGTLAAMQREAMAVAAGMATTMIAIGVTIIIGGRSCATGIAGATVRTTIAASIITTTNSSSAYA